ncbi:MAG TPA: PPC domain-containing protein, partial [Parafilimonas sp.]|nr:PPC domain-containing protein [Parafilimonas sp.]
FILISASRAAETEPNNDRASANTLALNGNNTGVINPAGDQDWWKVTTTGDGRLDITLTPLSGKYMWIYIYDNNGTYLLKSGNSNSLFTVSADGLSAGTYYVKIISFYAGDTNSYTISNSLIQPAQANDAEPNDTKALAKALALNGSKTGHVNYFYNGYRDSADWYKITTNADGLLRLRLTSGNGQYIWAYLYDNDGVTPLKSGNTNGTIDINADGLAPGTYYVLIRSFYYYLNNNYDNGGAFEPYTIADSLFTPAITNDAEPNDSVPIANTLALNGSTAGHSNYYYNHNRDANDWYKITTNADGLLRLRLTSGNNQFVWAVLYDKDGVTELKKGNTNATIDISADGLAAGTYYVLIKSFYYYLNNNYDNGGGAFETYTLADSLFKPIEPNDSEPNDSLPIAKTLAVNSSTTGHVNYYYNHKRDAADWYKITLPQDGMLRLRLTSGNGQYIWAYLFDHDGSTPIQPAQNTNGTSEVKYDGLAAGTYYVRINSYYYYLNNNYDNGGGFEPYTLADTLFTYSYAADVEPDDAPYQAKTLPANTSSTGHVNFFYNNSRNNVDWWKINYTGSGDLKLNVIQNTWLIDGSNHYYWFQVYKDTALAPIYSQNFIGASPDINLTSLTQGYYYVKIYSYYSTEHISYSITPTFTQVNVASIKAISYDTAASCSNINSITFSCTKSSAPYTVKLYRYNVLYATKTAKVKNITFDSLPVGSYYAKAWGDGATGNAF